jgi:hypothetical protein
VEDIMPLDYFSTMTSALIDQRVLMMLCQVLMPPVGKKFIELGFDLSMVAIQWFVCLFTTYLNDEVFHQFVAFFEVSCYR